jgi:4-hydroxy-3-polyprenylbenzoate decarboxylase
MALDNLRAFIAAIDAAGELVRVDRPVAVNRVITEIADRCMKAPGGGPALLFRQPTLLSGGASRYPLAVNLFGSERRMAIALGVGCLDEVGDALAALLNLRSSPRLPSFPRRPPAGERRVRRR